METGLRDFLACNTNLVLLRTVHIYPRVDIPEELPQSPQALSALSVLKSNIEEYESTESDSSPLNMMGATQEQVDIVALGPNSYLWLKNTAKIHILIHTPNAGEKSTYFGILHRL